MARSGITENDVDSFPQLETFIFLRLLRVFGSPQWQGPESPENDVDSFPQMKTIIFFGFLKVFGSPQLQGQGCSYVFLRRIL